MVSESSLSSHVSLISLDPVLASHITGTTGATTIPATSQNGSSPRKTTRTPDTDVARRHARIHSAPNGPGKKRSNSLRRVKNSTEVLRQRSTKTSAKIKPSDAVSDPRGGRNFTIGNVGTGGILYLTPSAYQTHPRAIGIPTPVVLPSTAPVLLATGETGLSRSRSPTNPSISSPKPRSNSPKHPCRTSDRRVAVANHGRSQSFSTVEEHRPSFSASKSRTLRIVINRPDTARPKTAREATQPFPAELSPTLEVPIPHYRIGTFRFSSQGTPMLRNSAYTRGSMTPSDITPTATNPQADHHFGAPPASSRKALAKLEAMQQDHESSSKSASMVTSTSASSVQPDVFDELTKIYDDPSVVRYCQNVREVTAATPARIIAQISSDSFMDYELVSDFFLTFRSYLSTYSVLDLLLARLRWAIGRLEDDGRIIRVRTFAALRHWILNYFMDDFFVDRRLRVRFCSEVNRLYADVKARPENGFSDLKLLRDLKRCWNGRCSLCWNPEDFELDGEQEEDIKPGGMIDAESTPMPRVGRHTSEIRLEVPQIEVLRGPSSSWFEADFTAQPRHRQQTSMSDYTSESLRSDGSVQANSCFVPMSLLRPSGDNDAYSKGPHPISVQLRRKNAPANLQVVTQPTQATKALGHRKGASSIDSNREPTPRTIKAQAQANVMEDGNIIRGLLYSPRAPFVQIISSNSTQSLDRSEAGVIRGISRREPGTQSTAQPGGRNIFGSLRKVLGSKHGQIDMALLTISQPVKEVPTQGNRSLLPLSVSKSHDELKAKVGRSMARKGEIRIDLLCAAVCQNYETKFPTKHRITYGALLASHPPLQPIHSAEGGLKTPRMASHATAQSGSILIVDDTGLDVHSMSGALHMNEDDMDRPQPRPAPLLDVPTLGSKAAFYDRNGSIDAITTQRSSDVLGDGIDLLSVHGSNDSLEPATFGANHANRSCEDVVGADYAEERIPSRTTASSRTVRDGNVSFDIPRPVSEGLQGDDSDPQPAPAESQELNEEEAEPETDDKLPKHTLRRRPGGDLRRVENVQQLDHTGQHQSLDTASAASYSPQGSLLIMKTENRNRRASADGPPTNKPISMINTHSSQHLRPSFEAAVAGFSAIPDDDDGGLEATLMKLEGRYEKKSPPLDQHPLDTTGKRRSLPDLNLRSQSHLAEPDEPISLGKSVTTSMGLQIRETAREIRPEASQDEVPTEHGTGHGVAVEMEPLSSRSSSIFGLPTESVAGSEESYGSLPLLKRETAYESVGQPLPLEPGAQPELIAPGYFAQDPPQLFHLPKGPPPSARKNRNSLPRPDTANESNHSFLLDEDENLSDLSSEISVDVIDYAGIGGRSVSPMLAAPGTAISGLEIPAHPLTYASVVNLNAPEVPFRISDPGPQSHSGGPNQSHGLHTSGEVPDFQDMPSHPLGHLPAGPAHIPFVLACDSQNLAQQMTLVEKSALCEVEWSDLVEMRWDHKAADILDWVDCLTTGTIRGIDLVITRFNLVVKWALSEIVLTHDIHERARVITKYIHVAAHARRLHNYATMLQLTIALTSIDCTRLSKTWELVSSPDRSLLKHMEALVQPIRNFHDLRLEMESADLSDGCVPFIGLYVHDLTYNAQKSSLVPSGRGGESLINFERYRTAARIVKGLLRLIDASSRYNFEPVEGVIERCLWLAALGDDQLSRASKSLEH